MIFNSSKFGFDISTYQDDPLIAGSVNFDKMVASGASFVILRSSVGNLLDVDFQTFKQNSRGKLPRGVYHYYWNTVSPVTQAQLCLSAIGNEKFEGRVWLDLETTTAGAYAGAANWKKFIETIQAAGLRVGIYTGYFWWKTYAIDAMADINYFAQFPLWQAWYTQYASDVQVAKPWSSMMIWQYSSTGGGYAAGVESANIDQNKWNDEYSFENEWTSSPLPPGEPPMTIINGRAQEAKGNLASVRAAPDVSGAKVGTLAGGTIVDFMALVPGLKITTDSWLQLPNGIHYVNQKVTGLTYFNILSMPTTPPPPPPVPAVSPVIFASMDFDLPVKTMTITRRRQDGTSDVLRDGIA